jgi:hypothetical protein
MRLFDSHTVLLYLVYLVPALGVYFWLFSFLGKILKKERTELSTMDKRISPESLMLENVTPSISRG